MLDDVLSSLTHSIQNAHGVSHEHRMDHILLKLLDILPLNGSFYSLIISRHLFIVALIILLLILRVKYIIFLSLLAV